jgi:hypothetical protein
MDPTGMHWVSQVSRRCHLANLDQPAPALATAIDLYTQLGDIRHPAMASGPLGVIRAVQETNGGEDLLAAPPIHSANWTTSVPL